MPVLGVIFLRHATNRYDAAVPPDRGGPGRRQDAEAPARQGRFLKRRALMLPKEARYDELLKLPKGANLGTALVKAMDAIERDFEPLLNQLPKDYDKFENDLLEDLLRIFDSETLRTASGDVFGRIYEYFLMKFAMQGAQDNGEFFTPPSLVQTIVNVIEPDHGIVFDPACGSGGMFVQTSHFIEQLGQDTAHRVTFFGQEKTGTTIRLAKMNLAVHGLEGDIREANTFYEDVHDALRQVRLRHGQSAVQRGHGGRREGEGRPSSAVRSAGREQGEEGLQRQLPLDFLLPQLSRTEGPRRLRHVVAGEQRRARRGGGAPQDRRDRRRGRDDLHPLELLLHPHRPLRAVAFRQRQAGGAPRPGADARCAEHLPEGHAQDLRLLARAARRTSRPSSGCIAASRTASSRWCRATWIARSPKPPPSRTRPTAFRNAYDALVDAAAPFLKTLPKDSPLRELVKERDDAAKACFAVVRRVDRAASPRIGRSRASRTLAAQKKRLAELDALARPAAIW